MYVILSVACLFVKTNEFITCTIYVHTECPKSMDTLNDSLGYLDIRKTISIKVVGVIRGAPYSDLGFDLEDHLKVN